ncbi:MAG: hypothetical protein PF694_09240 [Bacteroidetes bacterium]|jgi:hypothetical protein|nr:hypothetical protein [Bacteroidota bacterium]
MKPPKIIHLQNGKRNYIRFGGKPRMIISVFEFKTMEELEAASEKTAQELDAVGMPYLGSATEWNDRVYLLVATQFPDGAPTSSDQKEADALAHTMRYLADWYRYQVLKAQSN